MPGPGDFDPEEGESQDGDTNYLRCKMQNGRVVVDEAGPSQSDAIKVQRMMDDYPESSDELMHILDQLGIEDVEYGGEMMSVDEFFNSL